jgi:NADH-quinone oxidoreductase subunit I
MIGFLAGLLVTLKSAMRKPVTAQYPDPDKRLDIANRYMGFPALLWDGDVSEPYCTGCMVCIRACPTLCMSAEMKDNPLHTEEKSRRRKIIDTFEINLGRCILCGICVDVCNFDAIEMSHEHELSKYERNGNRVDLDQLIDMGKVYQAETGWVPTNPEKNSGVPVKKEARPKRTPAAKSTEAPTEGAASTEQPSATATAEAAPEAPEAPKPPDALHDEGT